MIELPRSSYYYAPVVAAPIMDDNRLAELVDDIQDEFPGYGYAPLAHCSNRQSAILGLFLVERDGAQKMLHVVDGALTLVSRDYIPCDSGYEVHMANWMMDDGRKFEKPMRPERRTGKIPDFVLRDTEPETYLEVWGRDDDKYNESKAEKLSLYRSNGMRLWQWNARRDRFPPPLPEPCK